MTERAVSGMRPTGGLHLGHYHGVLTNWLRLQEANECYFFVADWHALTTHYADGVAAADVREMAACWLAAGVAPETVFRQSDVPQHAELHLLLAMICPLPWLFRIPSYKEQREQIAGRDLATYGFLGYPLLQSADILIYRADWVPVGKDQVSHIEFCREVARRFNHFYGETLKPPREALTPEAIFPGLDGRKMSKSYGNAIGLLEDDQATADKIKTMPTDPARIRRSDKGDPDKCPVRPLHAIYSDDDTCAWVDSGCRSADIGCIECKKKLSDTINQRFAGLRARGADLLSHPDRIDEILDAGGKRARAAAEATMAKVRAGMGL